MYRSRNKFGYSKYTKDGWEKHSIFFGIKWSIILNWFLLFVFILFFLVGGAIVTVEGVRYAGERVSVLIDDINERKQVKLEKEYERLKYQENTAILLQKIKEEEDKTKKEYLARIQSFEYGAEKFFNKNYQLGDRIYIRDTDDVGIISSITKDKAYGNWGDYPIYINGTSYYKLTKSEYREIVNDRLKKVKDKKND